MQCVTIQESVLRYVDYSEHSMKSGSDSAAITYIEIENDDNHNVYIGARSPHL